MPACEKSSSFVLALKVLLVASLLIGSHRICRALSPTNYAEYTNFSLSINNRGLIASVTLENTLSNLTYLILTNSDLTASNGWGIWQELLATNNVTPAPSWNIGAHSVFFRSALLWSTCANAGAARLDVHALLQFPVVPQTEDASPMVWWPIGGSTIAVGLWQWIPAAMALTFPCWVLPRGVLII